MDIRRHARVAECTEQNGVEIAGQHGEAVRRDGDAIGEIAIGAPVEMGELDVGTARPG